MNKYTLLREYTALYKCSMLNKYTAKIYDIIAHVDFRGDNMSRTPLIICPECGQKARITKTARTHRLLSYQYCSCSDSECGLTFRLKSEFDKVLSPSAKSLEQLNGHCYQ